MSYIAFHINMTNAQVLVKDVKIGPSEGIAGLQCHAWP